jgi:hypothetical protein
MGQKGPEILINKNSTNKQSRTIKGNWGPKILQCPPNINMSIKGPFFPCHILGPFRKWTRKKMFDIFCRSRENFE